MKAAVTLPFLQRWNGNLYLSFMTKSLYKKTTFEKAKKSGLQSVRMDVFDKELEHW